MGNPHPTRSKPNKIGRKHTQGERRWQRARREKGKQIIAAKIKAERKRMRQRIKAYWNGELEFYPTD